MTDYKFNQKISSLAVDCGFLPSPQNGSKSGEDTTFPHSIEFGCDEGFIISGSALRKCLANGKWSGQETLCKGNS